MLCVDFRAVSPLLKSKDSVIYLVQCPKKFPFRTLTKSNSKPLAYPLFINNVRLCATRKLASEAGVNGLMATVLAVSIAKLDKMLERAKPVTRHER